MSLKERESLIQQFLDESNHELKEAGKRRVLVAWRAKLEKEPFHLNQHQIDEIVREVRRRFQTTDGSKTD